MGKTSKFGKGTHVFYVKGNGKWIPATVIRNSPSLGRAQVTNAQGGTVYVPYERLRPLMAPNPSIYGL